MLASDFCWRSMRRWLCAIGLVTVLAHPSTCPALEICAGVDESLWFAGQEGKIGKIATHGQVSYFPISPPATPSAIACAPDGGIWVIAENRLLMLDPSDGATKEFHVATARPDLEDIANGPDSAVWFTERSGRIGRATASGKISEHTPPWKSSPSGITAGPDGNIWFTDNALHGLGVYVLSGRIGEKSVAAGDWSNARLESDADYGEIVTGPDRKLWFTGSDGVGVVDVLSQHSHKIALPEPFGPRQLAVGPDRAIWVTAPEQWQIARIELGGRVHVLTISFAPSGISAGPDRTLWITTPRSIAKMVPELGNPQISQFPY